MSLANGSHHTVDLHNTTADIGGAVQYAMSNAYEPTDLSMELVDGDNHDVRVFDGDFGDPGFIGWTVCPPEAETGGSHPNKWCHGQRIRFNTDEFPAKYNTAQKRRALACHELGHTVGLRHYGNEESCMQTGILVENLPTDIAPHDRGHINAEYA